MIVRRAAVLLCFVMLSACAGGGEDSVQIGIKRTAVDLAFKDESIPPKPPEIRTIIRELDTPLLNTSVIPPLQQPKFTAPRVELCPKARPDAVPEQAVSINITKPPKPGKYTYLNKGTIKITAAIFNLTLPFPPLMRREVANVKEAPITDAAGRETGKAWQWDIITALGDNSVTLTYQMRPAAIVLLKTTRKTAGATKSFTPNPPVTIYEYGAEDNDWTTAGVDLASNTAMLTQGRIAKRDLIDVCGKVVDTYRATSSEVVQTADGSYSSQTKQDDPTTRDKDESDPNVYNYATHIGPIAVKEVYHFTENIVVVSPDGRAVPATIEWNYESQLASLDPAP